MTCTLNDPTCRPHVRTGRHNHSAAMIDALGERCWCGAMAWRILFGGILPARVQCDKCQAGFNITQRLRDCGNPRSVLRGRVQS